MRIYFSLVTCKIFILAYDCFCGGPFLKYFFCSYRESKMEILTGFYLVSSVVQNIAFLLSIYQQYWHFNKLLLCMSSSRKSYFDKLMLIVNLTHIHLYLSLKKFIVISIIVVCQWIIILTLIFFLLFFPDKFLAFSGPHNKSRIENGNY